MIIPMPLDTAALIPTQHVIAIMKIIRKAGMQTCGIHEKRESESYIIDKGICSLAVIIRSSLLNIGWNTGCLLRGGDPGKCVWLYV